MHGPKFNKLVATKMATDAIPKGGGVADAIGFLSDKDKIIAAAKRCTEWIETAIQAVRQAAEPNPWKNSTEEEIAEHLLKAIESRSKR